ncbi:MAG: hypothetical protein WC822_05900 [Candidatus Paceibacterota bacterium]
MVTPAGGRPPNFTPEQDAIILSVTLASEVNTRFAALGEPPSPPEAINARRAYLKRHGLAPKQTRGERLRAPAKMFEQIAAIQSEMDRLADRIATLQEEKASVQEALDAALRKQGLTLREIDDEDHQDEEVHDG